MLHSAVSHYTLPNISSIHGCVQVSYNFWLHIGILFVGPLILLQVVMLIATRSSPLQIFHQRTKRSKRAPRPEVKARKLLEAAAAAAITCNLNGRSPGVSEGLSVSQLTQASRKNVVQRLLARVGLTWASRSPLRERIHLETLVFLSVDYCATAPDVVADVILQVCPREVFTT